MFLSFTSSQVVYVNASAFFKTIKFRTNTPDTEETRPEYCLAYRRSGTGYRAAHFTFTTAPQFTQNTAGMRWTQFADAQNICKMFLRHVLEVASSFFHVPSTVALVMAVRCFPTSVCRRYNMERYRTTRSTRFTDRLVETENTNTKQQIS